MTHRPLCPEGKAAIDLLPFDRPCALKARPFVLAATIIASAMAFIDGSVVSIAIPAIQSSFGADIQALQWVVNSYLLFLGALILVGGGLGDRIGRRRIFQIGIVIFAVASLFCAVVPNIESLIVARALQGVGAALLVPQSLAIIAANFPKDVRGRAIGTWAAASAATTSLGPPLGGFLIDTLSWRAVFWINLPLSVLALWLAWKYVPESRNERASGAIDWRGSVIAIIAVGSLTYGLSRLSESDASLLIIGVAIVVGLAGVVYFANVESRADNPIAPPSLFRSRVFTIVNIVTIFLYGALSGVLFLLPFDLLAVRDLTASEAGLALLPIGIIIGVFSRVAGGLADTYGARILLVLGSFIVGIGCFGFALVEEDFWLGALLPIVVLSTGMAIVVSPLTTAVMNSAPDEKSGAASGVNNAASRLAGVLAIAVFGAIAGFVFTWLSPEGARFGFIPEIGIVGREAVKSAFQSAYAISMIFASTWAFLAAGLAYFLLPNDRPIASAVDP